jgi:voltage-gated potassium channel Kch
MRRPYTVLFYTLLAALGLLPLFRALSLPEWPIDIVLALSLLEASSAAMHSRHRLLIGLLATVIVVGLGVIFGEASSVGWVIVAVFASAGALRFMFNPGATWSEQLYAALSAYLLVGLFMGVLFTAIAARSPGAFLVLGTAPSPGAFDLGTGVYFSFVTLTTLGYGDIVPANELSRGLAIFEAVSGQLYLAVLVAALVNRRAPVQA